MMFLLAAAAGWEIVSTPATLSKRNAYESCVTSTARSFAKSRDTADLIAMAAIAKCRPKRDAYFASLVEDNRGADGRSLGPAFLSKLDVRLTAKVRVDAVLAITEVRARQ